MPNITHRLSGNARPAIAAIALLAVGGVFGGVAGHAFGPRVEMAPLRPVAIRTLSDSSNIVTVRGQVAGTYGNKFVLDDGTGRALVDTGRAGEDSALVANGQQVSAQGRFERGTLHASFLVSADGKVTALGPVGGPPHGRHPDPDGDRHGPGDQGPPPPPGQPQGANQAPPPPPLAATAATPPAGGAPAATGTGTPPAPATR